MKIYFSGSIRGGREHKEWYEYIVGHLSNYGEVLSEFVADKNLTSYGTLKLTDQEIYNRDIGLINQADIIVADVTVTSLGVGYEIGYAEKLNKKIYCLYHQVPEKRLSAMISGNPSCKVYIYETRENIDNIIEDIFK